MAVINIPSTSQVVVSKYGHQCPKFCSDNLFSHSCTLRQVQCKVIIKWLKVNNALKCYLRNTQIFEHLQGIRVVLFIIMDWILILFS